MHLPTTALFAITFSIVGLSKTVHADQTSKSSAAEDIAFQCSDRRYTKAYIFEVAQRFCDLINSNTKLRDRSYSEAGYRQNYPTNTLGDIHGLLNPDLDAVPILEDQTWFPFDLRSSLRYGNFHGQKFKIEPGPDRLIIDKTCVIKGAISQKIYILKGLKKLGVKHCIDLRTESDFKIYSPGTPRPSIINAEYISGIQPQQPTKQLRGKFLEKIPEIPLEQSTKRLRGKSPENDPEIPPQRYSKRLREKFSEIPLDRYSRRFRGQSSQISPERNI